MNSIFFAYTFRDEDWLSMADHMSVYSKDDIRVTFKDGSEVPV